MDLSDYRAQIDQIDEELVRLISERMDVSAGVAAYKKEHGLPVLDAKREREKLLKIAGMTAEDYRQYTVSLFDLLMELRSGHHMICPSGGKVNPKFIKIEKN